ncbi:hypothetical protein DL96DRAFT_1810399 [Flagelloscypha sp. PMI_526]|nr:hypothetical protein DL96DRAFT_1810399 [Flagelloscypha sp. PMI_526]
MSLRALIKFPLENLQRLELSDAWSFNAPSIPRLTFLSLRSLTISGRYSYPQAGSIPNDWFDQFYCPQLENLSLRYAYFQISNSHAFQGFLEMLHAPVNNRIFNRLSLYSCSFSDSQFESLLTSVPSITSFQCCEYDGISTHLPTILPKLQRMNGDFLPLLQAFDYECLSLNTFDDNMLLLLQSLEARSHGSLRRVKLRTGDSTPRSEYDFLIDPSLVHLKSLGRKMVDFGMEFDWQHRHGDRGKPWGYTTFF